MTRSSDVGTGADPITPLLRQIRTSAYAARERAAEELVAAVHQAVYPMCVTMLGSADEAYEAEAETIARLLKRAGSDAAADSIGNATAYVRVIARNVCTDLHRAGRRRADRPVEDLDEHQVLVAPVLDRKSTRLNSSHSLPSRMPSSA